MCRLFRNRFVNGNIKVLTFAKILLNVISNLNFSNIMIEQCGNLYINNPSAEAFRSLLQEVKKIKFI